MVQGKWFVPGDDLSAGVLPVRREVFGFGEDDLDPLSWNVLVYQDSVPAATGRIWWQDGAFRIGGIGVRESCRGRRLGDLVLRLLLYKAQNHSAREVRLRCPRDLAGFFARLGFAAVESSGPEETEMMIPGDQIDLDTCKKCPKRDCPSRRSSV